MTSLGVIGALVGHADRMTITLVTGATRGLGHETARRLVEAGHTVYVGARDESRVAGAS